MTGFHAGTSRYEFRDSYQLQKLFSRFYDIHYVPRRSRIVLPGRPHHVTQRGGRRQNVFFFDCDRHLYLELLECYAKKYSVDIIAYCLMTNHVHHLLIPSESALQSSKGRDTLNGRALGERNIHQQELAQLARRARRQTLD